MRPSCAVTPTVGYTQPDRSSVLQRHLAPTTGSPRGVPNRERNPLPRTIGHTRGRLRPVRLRQSAPARDRAYGGVLIVSRSDTTPPRSGRCSSIKLLRPTFPNRKNKRSGTPFSRCPPMLCVRQWSSCRARPSTAFPEHSGSWPTSAEKISGSTVSCWFGCVVLHGFAVQAGQNTNRAAYPLGGGNPDVREDRRVR